MGRKPSFICIIIYPGGFEEPVKCSNNNVLQLDQK